MKKFEPLYIATGDVKWCGSSGKVWGLLVMLNIELPHYQFNPGENTHPHKKLERNMHIALFIKLNKREKSSVYHMTT